MSEQKEENKEKVVTKYDLKMQRRQAEKEKEARNKRITTCVSVIAVIALVCFIASFPVRAYLAANSEFISVGGEKVTRVEFDYNYNNTVNNFINQNSSFISYFLDLNTDFDEQSYSDDMSWKDYFEQMTVDSMKTNKGLKAQAKAEGFTFDASERVADFKDSLKKAAKDADTSVSKYVKQRYGQYATVGNIAKCIEESALVSAYMDHVSEGLKASDEEISAYYEENASNFDSVDYYVETFNAVIPENATDEQIQQAMDEASNWADAALDSVDVNGELREGVTYNEAESVLASWLFADGRTAGDTTALPDDNAHVYYAVRFVSRYLDEQPTANAHIIITEDDGQKILDEWKAGEATEQSFVALWKKYSSDTSSVTDGLYENLSESGLESELSEWLFAEDRQVGDTGYVSTESGSNYVLYYTGQGEAAWKASISSTLLSDAQNEYVKQFADSVTVSDPKGNLKYLKIQAEEEAAAVSGGDVSDSDAADTDVSGDAEVQ